MREDLADLTDGLEGSERAARLALIDGLLGRGCTPGEIRDAHGRGRLTLLPLELTLRDEGSRSLEEIAAAHGIDPDALVVTVLDLVRAAEAPGSDLPRVRAGAAAGPARHRAGDWYGRTVNLASRLTALADPGTLSADPVIVAATPSVPWTPAGEREVRGFEEPVVVSSTRPLGP